VTRSKAKPATATATAAATTRAPGARVKVLVAVDGSDYTRRIIEFLTSNLDIMHQPAEFTVLHAVQKMSQHAVAVLDRSMVKRYYQDESARIFRPIRRRFKAFRMEANFVYKVGNAAEVISGEAESGKFDILIMGAQGAHPLKRLVMGSVVSRVMAECKVPVLLVT
jgi:nucleotide-binding universal stress UspA family protein